MGEILITPNGQDALQAGTIIDENGERFVVLRFEQPGADAVVVTFTVPLFKQYVGHLNRTAEAVGDEAHWQDHIV